MVSARWSASTKSDAFAGISQKTHLYTSWSQWARKGPCESKSILGEGASSDAVGSGSGFDDPPGADAGGADADVHIAAVHDGPHRAQVDVPTPPGGVVGVANLVSVTRTFAAEFAHSCHSQSLRLLIKAYYSKE